MRALSVTSFIISLALVSCAIFCHAHGTDIISKKTTSILCSLLNSKDPAKFSQNNNIELKDGAVKVILIVDAKFLPKDFEFRYDLKEFKLRNNTASAYIKLDSLKKICGEPGVIFVRQPIKLRAPSK
jgi:hypothetical protein